jgi:hypothetical protein
MHIFVPKLVPKPNYNPLLVYSPARIITYGQTRTIQYNKPWVLGKRGGQQGKCELLILTFIQFLCFASSSNPIMLHPHHSQEKAENQAPHGYPITQFARNRLTERNDHRDATRPN